MVCSQVKSLLIGESFGCRIQRIIRRSATGFAIALLFLPLGVRELPTEASAENSSPRKLQLALNQSELLSKTNVASEKLPPLSKVSIILGKDGVVTPELPPMESRFAGKVVALTHQNEFVFYSIDPDLQEYVQETIQKAHVDHGAIVVMEPRTGRILAIAGKSKSIKDVQLHSGFPAASLFKVITATAAIETAGINTESLVKFRGADHYLGRDNYIPNAARDSRSMTVGEALGKSCNPVFARLALEFISPMNLKKYAERFGFNRDLQSDVPVHASSADIPSESYELSRTGAGFGDVYLSPVHAATLMSGIANLGWLPRPTFVDKVISPTGLIKYKARPESLGKMMESKSAKTLLDMMTFTTEMGTSHREFNPDEGRPFPMPVPAKTGTLHGDNPDGLNNWFIASAPLGNPKIAIAVIVVNPKDRPSRATHLGKLVMGKALL